MALRVLVGGLFVGHGMQKLKGWFGGSGLEGTDRMMAAVGLHPVRRNSIAAGTTEAVGGAMLAAGLGTPVAAAGLIATMTTAVRKVHIKNGPWNGNGGWEYNAILIGVLTVLAAEGPGAFSLDRLLHMTRSGALWGLFALGGGAAASAAVVEMGRRNTPQADMDEGGRQQAGEEPSNDVGA